MYTFEDDMLCEHEHQQAQTSDDIKYAISSSIS